MKRIVEGLGIATMIMGLGIGGSVAADVQAAKKHLEEALASAQAMVSHGKQGDLDALSDHAEAFIGHAEAALDGIPADNEHGEEVVSHLKTAISKAEDALEHGAAGHKDVAMKHAEATLSHAKEAQSHAKGL